MDRGLAVIDAHEEKYFHSIKKKLKVECRIGSGMVNTLNIGS
jgi:hypothetical protein